MRKFIFLFLFLLVPLISAGTSCSVPGYQWCWGDTYDWMSAHAEAQIYFSFEDNNGNIWGGHNSYAVGDLYLNVGLEGRRIYDFSNKYASWAEVNAQCSDSGCNAPQLYFGKTKLASVGQEFKSCPVYMAWDRDDSEGYWAYTTAGYGWLGTSGTCVSIKSVNCYDNSDCSGQICDKSGAWQTWSCKTEIPVCTTGQEKCEGTTSYSCSNNAWVSQGQVNGKCGYTQCVPSCTGASNICTGQTFSDGCNGLCQGTKSCSTSVCGNNVCESSETISGCPSDCKNEDIISVWSKVFFEWNGIKFTLPLLISLFGGLIIVLKFLRGR